MKADKYEHDENDNVIAYHIESVADCKEDGRGPLSLDTLDDSKPLFLASHPKYWYPHHLPDADQYRVLKVVFKCPKVKLFTDYKQYGRLFQMRKIKGELEKYEFLPLITLQDMIKDGYSLIGTTLNNDQTELPECFLICPKQHVISIEEVEYVPDFVEIPGMGKAVVEYVIKEIPDVKQP